MFCFRLGVSVSQITSGVSGAAKAYTLVIFALNSREKEGPLEGTCGVMQGLHRYTAR